MVDRGASEAEVPDDWLVHPDLPLGPDPLADDFDASRFAGLLAGERRQIKGVLRDQNLIAGIGNAYSDEILHAAKM